MRGSAVPVRAAVTAATDPLVARESELGVLRAWCVQAHAADRLQVGLLAGESGVGKSRLVDELIGGAADEGSLVLRGTAHGTGFLAFEPWTEALRAFLRRASSEQVAAAHELCLRMGARSFEARVELAWGRDAGRGRRRGRRGRTRRAGAHPRGRARDGPRRTSRRRPARLNG